MLGIRLLMSSWESPKFLTHKSSTKSWTFARTLPGAQSTALKPKVLEEEPKTLWNLGHLYSELLVHWISEDETQAALELAGMLVRFGPDPTLEDQAETP